MLNRLICGLAVVGMAAIMVPSVAQAQLFNSNKKQDAQSDVYNKPGGAGASTGGKRNYWGDSTRKQTPQVAMPTDGGFTREGSDASRQDRLIREAAAVRRERARQKQAAIQARVAEMRAAEGTGAVNDRDDRDFGAMTAEEEAALNAPQIYDKHRKSRDPAAPVKLFNSAQ